MKKLLLGEAALSQSRHPIRDADRQPRTHSKARNYSGAGVWATIDRLHNPARHVSSGRLPATISWSGN